MTKENLPEKYNKTVSSNEQNQTPEWRLFYEAAKKVHTITPETPPEEVWNRISERNKFLENHPSKDEKVKSAQEALMQKDGLNPKEWMYYTATQPEDTKNMVFTEEDMERVASNFPNGFEFFAAPGQLMTNYDPGSEKSTMHFNENFWTIYVRRIPENLKIENQEL